jgi:hypothetical protein
VIWRVPSGSIFLRHAYTIDDIALLELIAEPCRSSLGSKPATRWLRKRTRHVC